MPIVISGTGNIWARTVYCREIISCSDLLLSDVHATIPYPLSDAANPALNTTNKTIIGAINECLGAIVAEDLWDRAGTVLYPHNSGDAVHLDNNTYETGTVLSVICTPANPGTAKVASFRGMGSNWNTGGRVVEIVSEDTQARPFTVNDGVIDVHGVLRTGKAFYADFVYIYGGGLSTNFAANSLTMGHDATGHTSWIQSAAVVGTNLYINPQGGNVGIKGTSAPYTLSVASTDKSDNIGFYHDNSDAFFTLTDGSFIFLTDEGINTNTNLSIQGKGTGYGRLAIRDEDNLEAMVFFCSAGFGYIRMEGTVPRRLIFQDTAIDNVTFFEGSTAGKTQDLRISGYNTGDALRTIGISCQYGGEAIRHVSPVELADDAEFALPDATAGWIHGIVEDGEEDFYAIWTSAAAVILRSNSTNVANTDLDTNLCIYPSGTQVFVKNRLGAAKKIVFEYHYWTP